MCRLMSNSFIDIPRFLLEEGVIYSIQFVHASQCKGGKGMHRRDIGVNIYIRNILCDYEQCPCTVLLLYVRVYCKIRESLDAKMRRYFREKSSV